MEKAGATYIIKESICGYKENTLVKVRDWSGDYKTCLVLDKKGRSTGEFIYAREKQLEKVEK